MISCHKLARFVILMLQNYVKCNIIRLHTHVIQASSLMQETPTFWLFLPLSHISCSVSRIQEKMSFKCVKITLLSCSFIYRNTCIQCSGINSWENLYAETRNCPQNELGPMHLKLPWVGCNFCPPHTPTSDFWRAPLPLTFNFS